MIATGFLVPNFKIILSRITNKKASLKPPILKYMSSLIATLLWERGIDATYIAAAKI